MHNTLLYCITRYLNYNYNYNYALIIILLYSIYYYILLYSMIAALSLLQLKRRSLIKVSHYEKNAISCTCILSLLIVSRIRSVRCLLLKKRISRKLLSSPSSSLLSLEATQQETFRFVSRSREKFEPSDNKFCEKEGRFSKKYNASHEYYIQNKTRLFFRVINTRFTTLPT